MKGNITKAISTLLRRLIVACFGVRIVVCYYETGRPGNKWQTQCLNTSPRPQIAIPYIR